MKSGWASSHLFYSRSSLEIASRLWDHSDSRRSFRDRPCAWQVSEPGEGTAASRPAAASRGLGAPNLHISVLLSAASLAVINVNSPN